jgi:hypothetical protein
MPFIIWLRRYVIVASIILLAGLAWASWRYYQFITSVEGRAWASSTLWGFTMRLSLDVLFVLLLLLPWWRLGPVARSIGMTVFLLSGAFSTWGSLWAALHGGGRLIFPVVITAFAAHSLWLFCASRSTRHEA